MTVAIMYNDVLKVTYTGVYGRKGTVQDIWILCRNNQQKLKKKYQKGNCITGQDHYEGQIQLSLYEFNLCPFTAIYFVYNLPL